MRNKLPNITGNILCFLRHMNELDPAIEMGQDLGNVSKVPTGVHFLHTLNHPMSGPGVSHESS